MVDPTDWIALVDDDPSVLKALTRSLRLRDLPTKSYLSAWEFLGSLQQGLPRCLVLDLQMPSMTGLELLQHLKRQHISIPTVLVTAHGDDPVRERCRLAGATILLSKPLDRGALFDAIEQASGRLPSTRG